MGGGPTGGQPPSDGDLHTGMILRFEPKKGYGFLKPHDINEDVFFLRQELPMEMRDAQSKDIVVDREVQFELKTMPDGKLRANNLQLTGGQVALTPKERREQAPVGPLDPALLQQMIAFLRSE